MAEQKIDLQNAKKNCIRPLLKRLKSNNECWFLIHFICLSEKRQVQYKQFGSLFVLLGIAKLIVIEMAFGANSKNKNIIIEEKFTI